VDAETAKESASTVAGTGTVSERTARILHRHATLSSTYMTMWGFTPIFHLSANVSRLKRLPSTTIASNLAVTGQLDASNTIVE
jgi:hypothetical protein